MKRHHVPGIPYMLGLTILSFILFTYEFNSRFKDYIRFEKDFDLKVMILIILNISMLVLFFQTADYHRFGGLYTYIFVTLMTIYLTFRLICFITHKISKSIGILKTLIIWGLIITYYSYRFHTYIYSSCENWKKGLSVGLDETNIELCKIPDDIQICPFELTDGYLDLSKHFRMFQCEYQEIRPDYITTYYKTEKPYIGHPLSKNFNYEQRWFDTFYYEIINNSKGYDTLEEALVNHEVIVDTKNSKMITSVLRNETLVKERQQTMEKSNKLRGDLQQNLMIVFIDTLSRQRLHKKLPETAKYLKGQNHKEFFRLHSLIGRTQENAVSILYGKTLEDFVHEPAYGQDDRKFKGPLEEKWESIFEEFKKQGFITGHTANNCETNLFFQNDFFDQYLKNSAPDHENLSPMCDPHIKDYLSGDMDFRSSFASTRRCIYNKDSFEYVFEYTRQFFSAYKTENKMLFMTFMDMHEGTSEVINYLDKPLALFLKEMEDENTAVFMFSDHGFHMGGIRKDLAGRQQEIELYNSFMIMNNMLGLTEQQERMLNFNQQKLLTHVHVYNFFKFWASGVDPNDQMSMISTLPHDKDTCTFIGQTCFCQNFFNGGKYQIIQ
ncbi:duf229 domain containing protein [Stylonychia lemnae]|uniref:Duf229 domain containing protein n=1 Tax=Stylonychia lemnae TaxID=5949 RepID=A0A078A7M3_STYLE|nr:duf229 domain containing protein [Stylonychia lemnae]|eukprot:CDW77562.1 duf229 domain containing protein [Stylonychia lemnae]